jgi:hypothetical protein
MAVTLLSLDNDQELDQFLADFINRSAQTASGPISLDRRRAVGGILKATALQELNLLDSNNFSKTEDELMEAEDFLRYAFSAAKKAGSIPLTVTPKWASRLAARWAAIRRKPKSSGSIKKNYVKPQSSERVQSSNSRANENSVRWIQSALNKVLNLRLAVDGILGPVTRGAIRSFQSKFGLSVDGIVGPKTKAALKSALQGVRPTVPVAPTPIVSPGVSPGPGAPGEPTVKINSGVVISDNALRILKEILKNAGLRTATITSGRRDSKEQARIMYNLIERHGIEYAKNLYGSYGDKVIEVYASVKAAGLGADEIKAAMQRKIVELGPSNVSRHTSDDYDVFDVAPSSIANQEAFRRALDAALATGLIDKYIPSNGDPAYHIEVKLNPTSAELFHRTLRAWPLPHAAFQRALA